MRLLNIVVQDGEEVHDLSEVHLPVLLLVDPLKHLLKDKLGDIAGLLLSECTWYSSVACPAMSSD